MYYVRMFGLLLIMNGLDILVGIVKAVVIKEVRSSKLRDGLFKKCGFIFCYMLGYLVDEHAIDIGIVFDVPICPAIAAYVFFTELISVIENIAIINPTLVPEKLLEMFHVKHLDA